MRSVNLHSHKSTCCPQSPAKLSCISPSCSVRARVSGNPHPAPTPQFPGGSIFKVATVCKRINTPVPPASCLSCLLRSMGLSQGHLSWNSALSCPFVWPPAPPFPPLHPCQFLLGTFLTKIFDENWHLFLRNPT